jgi:hypothetical protein
MEVWQGGLKSPRCAGVGVLQWKRKIAGLASSGLQTGHPYPPVSDGEDLAPAGQNLEGFKNLPGLNPTVTVRSKRTSPRKSPLPLLPGATLAPTGRDMGWLIGHPLPLDCMAEFLF